MYEKFNGFFLFRSRSNPKWAIPFAACVDQSPKPTRQKKISAKIPAKWQQCSILWLSDSIECKTYVHEIQSSAIQNCCCCWKKQGRIQYAQHMLLLEGQQAKALLHTDGRTDGPTDGLKLLKSRFVTTKNYKNGFPKFHKHEIPLAYVSLTS